MQPTVLAATLLMALAATAEATYVEPQLAPRPLQAGHKAVYHFNSGDGKLLLNLLTNIQNHLKATDGRAEIHLVIHNDGVWTLQEPAAETRKRLDELRGRQVAIRICNTSLRGRDIDWHSLHGVREEDIVASGVAEVVDLQLRGFAYIKP
jgi:hypothetical protein